MTVMLQESVSAQASGSEEHAEPRPFQHIEKATMRTLTMETSLTNNFARCHPQDQSPLYNKIPKEIRDLIFEFASAPYEDISEEQRYAENSWYYRPDLRGPLKTSTSLLATCRRVWLETSSLPMKQAVFNFWFQRSRGPPKQMDRSFTRGWTSLNREQFSNVHFFTQKHIADTLARRPGHFNFPEQHAPLPKNLRVTWRHTDWNRWEDPLPLVFDEAWVQRVLDDRSWGVNLQSFELELETLDRYKDQLELIVGRLCNLEGKPRVRDATSTTAPQLKFDTTHTWNWTGPANINDQEVSAHEGMEKLDYHVVVMSWKAVTMPAQPEHTNHAAATEAPAFYGQTFQWEDQDQGREGSPPTRWGRRLRHLDRAWGGRDYPFRSAENLVQRQSTEMDNDHESQRRHQFEKAFADIKTRELQEEWLAKGSLLKFESYEEIGLFAAIDHMGFWDPPWVQGWDADYGGDVLDNFDFDAFLNQTDDDGGLGFDANFAFGQPMEMD